MIPAILIILIVHIIIAIRWMLIKILSAVINDWEQIKVIVPGGCYLVINIIRKIEQKSRCCGTFDVRIFAGQDKRLPLGLMGASSQIQFKANNQFDKPANKKQVLFSKIFLLKKSITNKPAFFIWFAKSLFVFIC